MTGGPTSRGGELDARRGRAPGGQVDAKASAGGKGKGKVGFKLGG